MQFLNHSGLLLWTRWTMNTCTLSLLSFSSLCFWSERPTHSYSSSDHYFQRGVCPSFRLHCSKSRKVRQISSENNDCYWRDYGSGRVDRWVFKCVLIGTLFTHQATAKYVVIIFIYDIRPFFRSSHKKTKTTLIVAETNTNYYITWSLVGH